MKTMHESLVLVGVGALNLLLAVGVATLRPESRQTQP